MVSDVRLTASVFESDQANLRVTGEVGPLSADMAALRFDGDYCPGAVRPAPAAAL